MFKEFGVMPRKFKEQNGLIQKQMLSWQSFRNGFMAGYVQAMDEHNVLEAIKALEQMVQVFERAEEDGNYMDCYGVEDFDIDDIKLELKKAKEEWK